MTRIYRDAYERHGHPRPERAQLAAAAREAIDEFDEEIDHVGAR